MAGQGGATPPIRPAGRPLLLAQLETACAACPPVARLQHTGRSPGALPHERGHLLGGPHRAVASWRWVALRQRHGPRLSTPARRALAQPGVPERAATGALGAVAAAAAAAAAAVAAWGG